MSYGYHEKLLARYVKRLEETLKRWNPFTGDAPITVPREALPPAEKSPYASAGSAFDARKFWGRDLQEGAPAEGDAYLWDETAGAFVLGPAAGDEPLPAAAFKAYLIVDYSMATTPVVLPMTDVRYDTGSHYEPTTRAWTPPAGAIILMYRTRLNVNLDVEGSFLKNGATQFTRYSGRYSHDDSGWVEAVWMDNANGTDYYQFAAAGDSGELMHADTFWAGMAAGTMGGGGSGGGSSAPLTGDVTTAGSVSTLQALHGIPFTTATPVDGDFLVYSASANKLVWRAGEITTPDFAVVHDGDLVYSGGELVISTP